MKAQAKAEAERQASSKAKALAAEKEAAEKKVSLKMTNASKIKDFPEPDSPIKTERPFLNSKFNYQKAL